MHLVPDPNIPTSETGTRHRTAERVGRQLDVPVITVSEDMSLVAIHRRGEKHTLEPIPRVLARADQALQILGRYKTRLDSVSGSLSALEVEDLVTVRDVATVLQRAGDGAPHRRGDRGLRHRARRRRPAGDAPARGAHRWRRGGPSAGRQGLLHVVRRLRAGRRHASRSPSSTTKTSSTSTWSPAVLHLDPDIGIDGALQPRGFRLLHKIPRLPELVSDHVVDRFSNLQKIMRAGLADLTEVEGVGEVRAKAIKEGLSRLAETSILERYV